MAIEDERAIARYRRWYRKLLRFYSRPYRERFAQSMEQTFHDLCRERAAAGRGFVGFVLWMFAETSAGIVRENGKSIMMQNKNIIRNAAVTGCILLVPLLAGAPWELFDFVFAGTLLFGTGLTYELVARKGGSTAYRAAVGVACAAGLLLIWVNAAVGIIGNENQPANLMYFGMLALGLIGIFIARIQPRGMSRALFTTALVQALIPAIALVVWPQVSWGAAGMSGVFVLNAFFVALWIVSALLFRHAADRSRTFQGQQPGGGGSIEQVVD